MSLPQRPRHPFARPVLRTLLSHSSRSSSSLAPARFRLKRVIAIATTLLLALGVVTVGVAAPASAQTNAISPAVTCSADYTWQITWSVSNSESDMAETIANPTDTILVPVGTILEAGETKKFTETVASPVAKMLALDATWSNGVTSHSTGSITAARFTPACVAPATESTGLYLYKKLDVTKDAAWPNSGLQTKIATWNGWSYKTIYPSTLPSDVCGPGWGVQQDQINGPQSMFPTKLFYPNNGGFASGVFHAARHDNLSSLVKVPDCAPIPHVTVTTGACYANGDFSSANVYVALSNTGNGPVTFTSSNDVNVTLEGGESKKVEASPIWNAGGSFDIVATGTGFTQTFPITIAAFPDCGAVVTPNASVVTGDCVYSEDSSTADFRSVKITFDNSASNRPVVFTVPYFPRYDKTLKPHEVYSFDASNIYATGGGHTVVTAGKTFTLAIAVCPEIVAPVLPTATMIEKCGTDGSVVFAPTAGVRYALTTGDGKSGDWIVSATPTGGYRFAGTAQTVTFSGNLKARTECPVVTTCDSIGDGGTSTTIDHNGWNFSETGKTGHNYYVADGLHVYTEGKTSTDKAAGYHAISVPLAGVGTPSIDLTNSGSSTPGIQLLVDFNNDGVVDGVLVGESAYGADWWLSNRSAQFAKDGAPSYSGGFGSINHGTLNAWLAKFPTARVLGFGYDLGSGVHGDLVIHLITVGCNLYHFDHGVVVTPPTPRSTVVATCTEGGASTDVLVRNDFTRVNFTTGADFEAQIFVNGTLRDTLAVASGTVASKHYDFASKTGEYTVVVRVDGKTIAEKVVDSNCALKTEADPTPQTCVEGAPVDGQIHVLLNSHLVYRIDGVVATTADTSVTPGARTVTAKLADPKGIYVLDGPSSWTFDSAAYEGDCGQLIVHTLVTAVVTSVDRTCTVHGSYTLGAVDGVVYTVNGKIQTADTYQVSKAKTVNVVASVTSTDFGFEERAQKVWNLEFTSPANCGELTTLAFTGSNGTLAGGLPLGLIFVLFGAGVITVGRVRKRNS